MGFISDLFKGAKDTLGKVVGAAAPAIGTAIGGLPGTIIGSAVGGMFDRKRDQQKMGDYYDFYSGKGATFNEILGSGGVGGSPSSTFGQTLGNAAAQSTIAARQMQFQEEMQSNQIQADLLKTTMQTEAQKYTADSQFQGTVLTNETKRDISQLDRDQVFRLATDTTLPSLAADLRIKEEQLAKIINETKTSSPEFVKTLKWMTMSSENMRALLASEEYGIDPNNIQGSLNKLSASQKRQLITTMLAMGSAVAKETAGASHTAEHYPDLVIKGATGWLRYIDELF